MTRSSATPSVDSIAGTDEETLSTLSLPPLAPPELAVASTRHLPPVAAVYHSVIYHAPAMGTGRRRFRGPNGRCEKLERPYHLMCILHRAACWARRIGPG